MLDIDRTFIHDETVKLRSKPSITGKIMAINQINGVPVSAVLYGWGERFFEELAHLDEILDNEVIEEAQVVTGHLDPKTGAFVPDKQ